MKKKTGIAIAVVAVVAVAGGAVVAKCYLDGKCGARSAAVSTVSAEELLTVAREHDAAALRAWLVRQGPDTVQQVTLALDNTNDQGARVRISILRTIDSLGAEGLSAEAIKAWALALRNLAKAMLHDGPARSEHIARSFVLEGRGNEAAAEYARFPESQAAAIFFGQNPDLRSPASAK